MSGAYNVEAVVRDAGIVDDLAKLPAPVTGLLDDTCALCSAIDEGDDDDLTVRTAHMPECPWRRAREARA